MFEGRTVEHPLVVGEKEPAGGSTPAIRDPADPGPVDVHEILLIATAVGFFLALENQHSAVAGEVRFGIVAAEGQLANVLEMLFSGFRLDRHLTGTRAAARAARPRQHHCRPRDEPLVPNHVNS